MKKKIPKTIQRSLDFSYFKIGVKADSGIFESLFKTLGTYESPNADTDIKDGLRIIRCRKNSFFIPDRAIRTHINHERGTSVYILKQDRIFLYPDFAITLQGGCGKARLEYRDANQETLWQAGQLLRWLIHYKAFKKKLIYFPGQFLSANPLKSDTPSNFFLVTGHPECGKTACLASLKSLGAKLAGPDMLMTETLQGAFSFNIGFPGKKQTLDTILKLFPGQRQLCPAPRSRNNNNLSLSRILVVNMWGKKNSLLKQISRESCAAELTEFNKRSYEYFSQSQIEYLAGQYAARLNATTCQRLWLGTDRRKLRDTMAIFLNNEPRRNQKVICRIPK